MPGGDGAAEAERVADRDHRVADLRLRRVAERQRRRGPSPSSGSTLSTARSVTGSTPMTSASISVAVLLEADGDLVGALDHVGVGEDRAVLVDHEARAGGGALLLGLAERATRRRCTPSALDEDDAAALLAVDVGDGAAARVEPPGRTPAARSAPGATTRGGVAGVDHVRRDQDRAEHEHDQAAEHAGEEVGDGGAASWDVGVMTAVRRPRALEPPKRRRPGAGRPAASRAARAARPRRPPPAVSSRRSARRSRRPARRARAGRSGARAARRRSAAAAGPGGAPERRSSAEQRGAGAAAPSRAAQRPAQLGELRPRPAPRPEPRARRASSAGRRAGEPRREQHQQQQRDGDASRRRPSPRRSPRRPAGRGRARTRARSRVARAARGAALVPREPLDCDSAGAAAASGRTAPSRCR